MATKSTETDTAATQKKSTTRKPTTRKPATTKKESSAKTAKPKEVKETTTKKYSERDIIMVRSITVGELIYIGHKSRNRYVWGNSGDVTGVEAGDLDYLKYTNSPYLFTPYFIIEDEDFLSQPSWGELRKMYEEVKDNDVKNILSLPIDQFRNVLPTLKEGYKNSLLSQMSSMIESGELDSINKIKAVDEIFGTSLMILV